MFILCFSVLFIKCKYLQGLSTFWNPLWAKLLVCFTKQTFLSLYVTFNFLLQCCNHTRSHYHRENKEINTIRSNSVSFASQIYWFVSDSKMNKFSSYLLEKPIRIQIMWVQLQVPLNICGSMFSAVYLEPPLDGTQSFPVLWLFNGNRAFKKRDSTYLKL